MIRNSFIILEGISTTMERSIWKQGILDWNDFIERRGIRGIGKKRKGHYDRRLIEAKKRLYELDSGYFYDRMPMAEQWRLYEFFKEEAVFFDIEASGLGEEGYVTVVGLFDGINTKTMVRGVNLDFGMLKKELERYKMIVSFNGSVFDEPFMRKRYPGVLPKIPHFDLRFGCMRLGMKGGLKEIERRMGIKRQNSIVEKMYGGDAAKLWRMWKGSGDERYLKLLVEYNEEDAVNLKQIAETVYEGLKALTGY